MRMIFLFFIVFVGLSTVIVEANSQLTLSSDVEAISTHITSIKICGSWNYDGKHGKYRIITGWLYGHSEIYIQWLTDPDIEGISENSRVAFTLSIPRFNNYESATDITEPICKKTADGQIVSFSTINSHDGKKSHIRIKLFYEYGKFLITERPIPFSPPKSKK